MPSYEYECSNYLCEANLHVDKAIPNADKVEMDCPLCQNSMDLIYANAEI